MSFFDRIFPDKKNKDTTPTKKSSASNPMTRRAFLRDAFLGTAGAIIEPKIQKAETLFLSRPREVVETSLEVESSSEFAYLLHPLEIIDDLCNKITTRSQATSAERNFLTRYSPNGTDPETKERRECIRKTYEAYGQRLVTLLDDLKAMGLIGSSFYTMEKFYAIWSSLHFSQEKTEGPFVEDYELNQLEDVVQWLRPLEAHDNYLEQKKAYVPHTDQVERVMDEIFAEQVKNGMKYSRSSVFDRQYALDYYMRRGEKLPENFDELYPPGAAEYVRLVSQKDTDTMRAELAQIDAFMPLALTGIRSVSEQDMLHYGLYRAYHTYEQQAVKLGGHNVMVANWLYHTDIRDDEHGVPQNDIVIGNLSESLKILVHEINHAYDPQNYIQLEQYTLHPGDLLEYCETYRDFYHAIFDAIAPRKEEKKKNMLTSDDLIALFLSRTLPIFGEDEFVTSNKDMMNRLFTEVSDLLPVMDSICLLSQTDLEKIGLSAFFSIGNTSPLPILQVLCREDDSEDREDIPSSPGFRSYLKQYPDSSLAEDTFIGGKHLSNFFNLLDRVATNSVDPTTQPELREAYLQLKSFYQFLAFVALERLKNLYEDEGRSQDFDRLSRYYLNTRNRIIWQLAHCLVGPFGEYVPTWNYISTTGIHGDTPLFLTLAKEKSDTALDHIQSFLQEKGIRNSNVTNIATLRDTVWDTQVELQWKRALMLGSDISKDTEVAALRGEEVLHMFHKILTGVAGRLGLPIGSYGELSEK